MKISIDWLKEYVDIRLPADELAERLTMGGLEVEELERIGSDFEGIVVGEVLEVNPHPNADRLTVCRVDVGEHDPLSIVCGAPNVAAGQKVPVATVGSRLTFTPPGSALQTITIKRAKLRGEVSEGMICAEDELGLSDDHSGIMVLGDDAVTGTTFRSYLDQQSTAASDTILDIAITPNRPDATSHFGVARDVAALSGSRFERPPVDLPPTVESPHDGIRIDIESTNACRRYVGLVVRGVRISESPVWLKRRLTAVGLRPRNNVVDITNFVMYECGQPLHAFDLEKLSGNAIKVRLSSGGERFTTLDDRTHSLPEGTLLICDAEKPVALAGIMGGENSEVSEETTDILIESAYFDPTTIRRAAKKLSIQTDSSYRFERGVDSDGQLWAAARAARLIAGFAGGTVADAAIDVHPSPLSRRRIDVRTRRVNDLLGTEIADSQMHHLLNSIGFSVSTEDGAMRVDVPSFRPDVEREVDVIEEIARLHGYDRIPEPARSSIPNVVPREDPGDTLRSTLRERLAGLGYHEVHTNSMLRAETADRFNQAPLVQEDVTGFVETLNPISREMAALRPSLLPGILQVVGFNQNHGQRGLSFFEFGHVFARSDHSDNIVDGYRERDQLMLVTTGAHVLPGWASDEREADIFDVRGVIELLFGVLRVRDVDFESRYQPSDLTAYHLDVQLEGSRLGIIGRVSDSVQEQYRIDTPVYFAALDLQMLVRAAASDTTFRPISRFPVVERDLAVVVRIEQPADELEGAIRGAGAPLLQSVELFDLYEGDRIPEGTRSLAFSLRFGTDRTLTDREVDERIEAITLRLKDKYGADLRQ